MLRFPDLLPAVADPLGNGVACAFVAIGALGVHLVAFHEHGDAFFYEFVVHFLVLAVDFPVLQPVRGNDGHIIVEIVGKGEAGQRLVIGAVFCAEAF